VIPGIARVVGLVIWHAIQPGVWQAELPMAKTGPLSSVKVVAVRLDPRRVGFSLQERVREERTRGAWTVDSMPHASVVALNAGQFIGGFAWGWLVNDGMESQAPGSGSLAMAFVVDSSGKASLVQAGDLAVFRGHVRLAFQSYPALLTGEGELPWELQSPGRGADLEHRDSRLALGILADGSVVVALTRFNALGRGMDTLPWGPTAGEMADFMRSLGCRRAVLLDGGISSQLAVRRADGSVRRWSNWRAVPLGLIVTPRDSEVKPASGPSARRSTSSRPLRPGTAAVTRPGK
jgi:uncharacterized protein YigE (DUF2233 family)